MTPSSRARLREDVRGFAGRFFYDAERGDIAYIAKRCDDRTCDCEENLNSDGEQDCSVSIAEIVDAGEPIARMLNAVGQLLDANSGFERQLSEARSDRDRLAARVKELEVDLRCEQIRSEDRGNSYAEVRAERDSLRAELDRMRPVFALALAWQRAGHVDDANHAVGDCDDCPARPAEQVLIAAISDAIAKEGT